MIYIKLLQLSVVLINYAKISTLAEFQILNWLQYPQPLDLKSEILQKDFYKLDL